MKLELERINVLWFVTLGVTMLASGLLIYILLLESTLGAFSIHAASPAGIGRQAPRVALLNSDYTRQTHLIFNPNDQNVSWLDETLRSWREFLLSKNRRISFSEITDEQVEAGDLDAFDTVLLPDVRAMSDRQIEAIKIFMERGGSVLATWTPGLYRPDGTRRGWRFIEEAFGVSFVGFVERGTGNYQVYRDTFPGFTPPGIYRPDYLLNESASPPEESVAGNLRERMQQVAKEADFPPLRGYKWTASLEDPSPQSDFASADTIRARLRGTDGQLRLQNAVAVTYYTWNRSGTETDTPYTFAGEGFRRFTLRGGTPLTANIPSGYRLQLQVANPGVRMQVVEPRTIPVGFWYDVAVEDQMIGDALATTTGAVYGTYGEGRYVYLGFQKDAVGSGSQDREDLLTLETFFNNVMDYLRRRPVIWVHDWPYPHEAGAVLSGIGGTQFQNFSAVADVFAQEGISGTYFVRPQDAQRYEAILHRLYEAGDVGVLDDLRGENDASEHAQRERLSRLKETLENVVGGPVTGYRSPSRGQISEAAMAALTDAGYEYILPDSIGRLMTPRIMGFPHEALVQVGVTANTDRDVFRLIPDNGEALRSILLKEDIIRAQYEGGIYHLMYSSDLLGRPENRELLQDVARFLNQENFWIQSADQVAHWWRLRQGLSTEIEQRGPHRIVMRVSNNNGSAIEQMGVTIALGRRVNNVRIHPELIGAITPAPILQAGNTELVLMIEQLKPQQNRIFHIDLLNEETDRMLGMTPLAY